MPRRSSVLGCLLALVLRAHLAAAGGAAQEAIAAEHEYWKAEARGDLAALDALTADDFIQVTTGPRNDFAVTRGKPAAMKEAKRFLSSGTLTDWNLSDPVTQVVGDTVVLTYQWTQTFVPSDGPGRANARNTRGIATSVWTRRGGRWQNVNFHWHTRPADEALQVAAVHGRFTPGS